MIQSTIDKLLTNWSFGNFTRKLIFANEIIQDISQTGTFANSRIYEHMSYWTPNHVRIPFSSLCCFLSANMLNVSIHLAILNHLKCTAWKLFVLGVFLVRIFGLNTDQRNAEYGHFSRSDELRHNIFAKYKSGFLKMNFTSTDLFLEDLLS